MEILREMVKSIVSVIILATFLEIILPRSDMKRYINLVIGLYVIVAMLNPVLSVVRQDYTFEMLENSKVPYKAETESLISKGKTLAADQKLMAAKQYKEKLAGQIKGLAELYQNNKISRVSVDMIEDPKSPNFGQIEKIILHQEKDLTANPSVKDGGGQEIIRVEDVSIKSVGDPKLIKPPVDEGQNIKLNQVLADLYGLTKEQVEIRK